MNEPIPQEAYAPLSTLITALGVGLAVWGIRNLIEGYSNNIPSAQSLGERQLRAGGNLVFLAACVKEGHVPDPEIMEYLAER